MAADHRKKRLVAGSIGSSNELHQTNKKKVGLFKRSSYRRSNVSLEWDEKNNNVVAKREQIGLSRRDLVPFLHLVHCNNFVLAGVLSIPQEIFELENLSDVMSYEVWQRLLSESERDYLRQFLPQEVETQEVVRGLLGGDNFHFGNPFIKWGTSVCQTNVHPDSVIQKELHLREKKKVFYSGVEQYHNKMISNLLMWRDRWLNSEDSESHNLEQMWSEKRRAITFDHANEIRYPDADEDVTATSESSSWGFDDKTFSSDNPNLLGRQRELKNGRCTKTSKILSPGPNMVEKPRKGQKLQKRSEHCSDGTKYMSYIKVSKEQHQLVVSTMKQSSNGIQSKSLSRVLGDLNTYQVQPFEVFEEEEQKKLRIHWIHLVKKDLPIAFSNWRRQQLQRCQLLQSLEQEILEMPRSSLQEEKIDEGSRHLHHAEFGLEDEPENNAHSTIKMKMDGATGTQECSPQEYVQFVMVDNGMIATSAQNNHSVQIGPLSDEHEFHNVDFSSNNNVKSMTEEVPHHTPEFPESFSTADISSSQGGSISPSHNLWAANVPESFYNPPLSNEYDSTEGLSMDHSRIIIEDHPAQMINTKSSSDGQTHDKSYFNLCLPPLAGDGNELLQQFLAVKESLPYHNERKQICRPANFPMMQVNQFPGHHHLGEQMPLETRQNMFNGDPRLSSVSTIENWAASSIQMPPPLPQTLISEQNCFYGNHWSNNMDCGIGPSHLIGNGTNVHSSLYGGELHLQQSSISPYCSVMTSPEQIILPSGGGGAFGGFLGGGMSTTGSTLLPHMVHPQPDWPEPSAAIAPPMRDNNLGRLGMSHQNFSLQDSIAKSFSRSWKS